MQESHVPKYSIFCQQWKRATEQREQETGEQEGKSETGMKIHRLSPVSRID